MSDFTVIEYEYDGETEHGRWKHKTLAAAKKQIMALNLAMDTVDTPLTRIIVVQKGKRKPVYEQQSENARRRA